MLYLGIFLVIALLILFSPVKVTLKLHTDEKALNYYVKIFLLKFILIYKKSVEAPNFFNFDNKKSKTDEESSEHIRNDIKKSIISLFKNLNNIISTYCSNRERFTNIQLYIKRKFEIKVTNISILEGTGDAAQTAILYGLLWSLAGTVNAILLNFLNISFKNISFNCDYNNKTFKSDVNCIFKFSIVNIIIVFLRLNYIIKKYNLNVKKI